MDPTIGFLNRGVHQKKIQRQEHKHRNESIYSRTWDALHMSAVMGTDALNESLDDVQSKISCPQCVNHMYVFRSDPQNAKWILTDPEFFVYKLHTAANARARLGGKKSSFPPIYSTVVKKYRKMVRRL